MNADTGTVRHFIFTFGHIESLKFYRLSVIYHGRQPRVNVGRRTGMLYRSWRYFFWSSFHFHLFSTVIEATRWEIYVQHIDVPVAIKNTSPFSLLAGSRLPVQWRLLFLRLRWRTDLAWIIPILVFLLLTLSVCFLSWFFFLKRSAEEEALPVPAKWTRIN